MSGALRGGRTDRHVGGITKTSPATRLGDHRHQAPTLVSISQPRDGSAVRLANRQLHCPHRLSCPSWRARGVACSDHWPCKRLNQHHVSIPCTWETKHNVAGYWGKQKGNGGRP